MEYGTLYLVGVPIGHYDDITYRAVETLKKIETIAAEDTRKAKKLLSHFLIKDKDVLSHGSHNEHSSVNGLVALLQKGKDIAYVSDAGMPGISDPGYMLVRGALQGGIDVKVVPGVTAAVTAVAVSGIPCDKFTFQGFMPRKKGERERFLDGIELAIETQIFYEAPHRVLEMLENLAAKFPKRGLFIGRELTKTHEEFLRGSVEDIFKLLSDREEILGEFTLVMEGHSGKIELDEESLNDEILNDLKDGLRAKDIRDRIAKEYQLSKKDVYTRILNIKKNL